MITRIGSFANFNQLQFNTRGTMSRLNDYQVQISSGLKSKNYDGIARDAARLVGAENTQLQLAQYQQNITRARARLTTMEVQINSLLDTAISMKTTLTSALNIGNAKDQGLGLQAGQYLKEVESILNTEVDGVYLFGGGITDKPPVDMGLFTTAPDPLVTDTDYYTGDDFRLNVQIDANLNLKYGTKANEEPFEKYIRAFRLIQNDPIDRDNLRNALEVLNQSIDAMVGKISEIGSISATIERVSEKHTDAQLQLKNAISSLQDADILEATTRLSAEETALQASYLMISRYSRISLLNFLN